MKRVWHIGLSGIEMVKQDYLNEIIKQKDNSISKEGLSLLYDKFEDIRETKKDDLCQINYYWEDWE